MKWLLGHHQVITLLNVATRRKSQHDDLKVKTSVNYNVINEMAEITPLATSTQPNLPKIVSLKKQPPKFQQFRNNKPKIQIRISTSFHKDGHFSKLQNEIIILKISNLKKVRERKREKVIISCNDIKRSSFQKLSNYYKKKFLFVRDSP